MLCLILSEVLCYASGAAGTENDKGEGTPLIVKEKITTDNPDKGASINSSISGHILTVAFTESLGEVAVEVETISGGNVQCLSTITPNGIQFYIPNAGDYMVTFTLPNGDEYYGEFTVTE